MEWNWQHKEWPKFTYDEDALKEYEVDFLKGSSVVFGAVQHITENDKKNILVEIISEEALKTSEIEGEMLDRGSVQSSIRRNLGLKTDNSKIPQSEQGISDMMTDLYETFSNNISHEYLFNWHKKLTTGRKDISSIGAYRSHEEPMQVVSGFIHKPKIHFEAPPSSNVIVEMGDFIKWFNNATKNKSSDLKTLSNAGIAHLYFVSIHPFEDGNGRIGRSLAEKMISSILGYPVLLSISNIIQDNRKKYYEILEQHNTELEVTAYLKYFAKVVLDAQVNTQKMIEFIIKKIKIYDLYKDRLNVRQNKVLGRIFEEGLNGFKGGLSAQNYINITKTSRATATRDLQEMVNLGVVYKTGELKHTRYYVNGLG